MTVFCAPCAKTKQLISTCDTDGHTDVQSGRGIVQKTVHRYYNMNGWDMVDQCPSYYGKHS